MPFPGQACWPEVQGLKDRGCCTLSWWHKIFHWKWLVESGLGCATGARCLLLAMSSHLLLSWAPQVALCFSPVGNKLRVRSRRFPAIVSCTAIDWFQEWPREALESVSLRFLRETETVEVSTSPTGICGCLSLAWFCGPLRGAGAGHPCQGSTGDSQV